jgi:hypothetical protein
MYLSYKYGGDWKKTYHITWTLGSLGKKNEMQDVKIYKCPLATNS